jgi:hypothetical protein
MLKQAIWEIRPKDYWKEKPNASVFKKTFAIKDS